MVGHSYEQCCPDNSMAQLVKKHGPNLISSSTHTSNRTFDINKYLKRPKNFLITSIKDNTLSTIWKTSYNVKHNLVNPVNTNSINESKEENEIKPNNDIKIPELYTYLNGINNKEETIHITKFVERIKDSTNLKNMGTNNWNTLASYYKQQQPKNVNSIPKYTNNNIKDLGIFAIFSKQLLTQNGGFNGNDQTLIHISEIFIIQHTLSLMEEMKSRNNLWKKEYEEKKEYFNNSQNESSFDKLYSHLNQHNKYNIKNLNCYIGNSSYTEPTKKNNLLIPNSINQKHEEKTKSNTEKSSLRN